MSKLETIRLFWEENGFRTTLVDAPKDACLFDKMVIIFFEGGIKRVICFSERDNKITAEY